MLYDRIALEKHIYIATRAERIPNSKHWILTANSGGGTQQPLNQRPDFAQAKRECKRLHDEHLARAQQEHRDIPRSQQRRQRKIQQFEGNGEYYYAVDPKTGWRFYKGSRRNLQTTSSSSSTWDQTQWRKSNWNSQHSPSPDDWYIFLRVRTRKGSSSCVTVLFIFVVVPHVGLASTCLHRSHTLMVVGLQFELILFVSVCVGFSLWLPCPL